VGIDFIGGRRLGAWEAVAFGEPYVESAQAMVIEDGLLSLRAMVSETSVALPIRLDLELITLRSSNGRENFHHEG
jgi:hypothetical protein